MRSYRYQKGLALSQSKGFTLVEMLIVIAIIAILASVALVSVRGVRTSANDTKRISDLNKVQQLLEVYYTKNGNYPATPADWAGLGTALGTTLANDPGTGRTYAYAADGTRQHYVLQASLEAANKLLDEPNELDGTQNTLACDDASPNFYYCVGN